MKHRNGTQQTKEGVGREPREAPPGLTRAEAELLREQAGRVKVRQGGSGFRL